MINIEVEKWQSNSEKIRKWLERNDAGAMAMVIEKTLDAGDQAASDYDRNRFWEAVRALCKSLPNGPFRGRGFVKNQSPQKKQKSAIRTKPVGYR